MEFRTVLMVKKVGKKWLIFAKWLIFLPTKFFADFYFTDKVHKLKLYIQAHLAHYQKLTDFNVLI